MVRRYVWAALVVMVGVAVGCGPAHGPKGTSPEAGREKADPAVLAEGKKYVLEAEPGTVQNVVDLRKEARDGDAVAVAGRVGGSTEPFTEGRAGFLLVDASFQPALECECPWDYCEMPEDQLAAGRVHVKFMDDAGKTLRADARDLFGLKELSTVVVRGQVRRDDKDNVTVVADGIYVRKDQK